MLVQVDKVPFEVTISFRVTTFLQFSSLRILISLIAVIGNWLEI